MATRYVLQNVAVHASKTFISLCPPIHLSHG